jgi:hypothetical protein
MSTTPVAVARERAGISVPSLATTLGITEQACWDLMHHPGEVSLCLTLRQLLQLATTLSVSPLSLIPDAPPSARVHRTLPELAAMIRDFCAARGLSVEQFGERAGWDVRGFLRAPDSALNDWCLDTLRHVCHALDLHWPDFLSDATPVV